MYKIVILKRYDVNGSSTGDIDLQFGDAIAPVNSMWRIDEIQEFDSWYDAFTYLQEEFYWHEDFGDFMDRLIEYEGI